MTVEFVHQDLISILNGSLRETTSRFAGIQLCQQDGCLFNNVCTIHTVLEAPHRTALLLYADSALLLKLAQKIMHREEVSQRDIEDVATEYFNVVCGRIAAGLYRSAHIASRFQTPSFCAGCYLPAEEASCKYELSFKGENDESVRLVCMGPLCGSSNLPENPPP